MNNLQALASSVIQWSALALLLLLVLALLVVFVLYVIDRVQTANTIRRNYPVFGRFRYYFEYLGKFFRQYFSAMDREELPFNRAERSWVYRAAKKADTTIAFGSTRPMDTAGEIYFLHSSFPTLEQDAVEPTPVTIGGGYCSVPYTTRSIINISGMSFGSISKPAVLALSNGARKADVWLNTGEGGLSSYHLDGGCDIVYQIGSAKYGVRGSEGKLSDDKLKELSEYAEIKMFEIKISQGAKPGKGGILPGIKVIKEVAEIRGISAGKDSISPNGHEDIKSVDDLLDMVNRIRDLTGRPTGFKIVVGQVEFFHDLFVAIHRRGIKYAPDFITIDGADGGTGAAPQPLMDYVGMLLRESLPIIIDMLYEYGLRDRIKVIASGKLITPGRVAWALCVGADFVTSARGFMFALGCIQALRCNKNTCPTGIATHDPDLLRGLVPEDKAERVANFARKINYSVGLIAHACGVTQPRELRRSHVRVIESGGTSCSLSDLYPQPETRTEYISEKSNE